MFPDTWTLFPVLSNFSLSIRDNTNYLNKPFLCEELNQTSPPLLPPPRHCDAAERKKERGPGPRTGPQGHAAAVAPASELQWAEAAEAGLGHPTHQRAGELARPLPAAAREGKWGPGCAASMGQGGQRLFLTLRAVSEKVETPLPGWSKGYAERRASCVLREVSLLGQCDWCPGGFQVTCLLLVSWWGRNVDWGLWPLTHVCGLSAATSLRVEWWRVFANGHGVVALRN